MGSQLTVRRPRNPKETPIAVQRLRIVPHFIQFLKEKGTGSAFYLILRNGRNKKEALSQTLGIFRFSHNPQKTNTALIAKKGQKGKFRLLNETLT
jgi:hypothetical protein